MTLSLLNPATSPNNDTTPEIRIGGVLATLSTTLYQESTCTNPLGTGVAPGVTIDIISSALPDATYDFHALVTDGYGNTICSANSVNYVLDTAAPDPSTWTWVMSSPADTSESNDNTPQFAISGVLAADNLSQVQLYDAPGCAGGDAAGPCIGLMR